MEWKSAYNCMLASLYHLLKHNHKLQLEFESIVLQETLLHLYHYHLYLLPESPEVTAERFAERIGIRLCYPDVGNPEEALDFACRKLAQGFVVPVNINLKYDILTPLSFDNDMMHYHLITGRGQGERLKMYDQFEDVHYEMSAAHLKKAIDTAYNRRFRSRFTPFMQIEFTHPPLFVQEQLQRFRVRPSMLAAIACGYPYEQNLQNGKAAMMAMKRFTAAAPTAEEKYKYMNFQDIVVRIRLLFCETARRFGYPPTGELEEWLDRHYAFKRSLGLALVRRKLEDWRRLESELTELLAFEHKAAAAIADFFAASLKSERSG
ncbi:hypothetical protein DUZ99_19355 [Xylanibacillus composti]|uniref:Uncharacterized protein n=1 Tax=Xylanibacillus composti TaxID=1572762 RepID=A0A8J4H0V4_9BACL|nr:hypothetical protein [Xylanibacillus composti]MDT9727125.1 hypothetical protein [Xylanibacillus composti]GIQ68863.1 hypothetical protein XYCOK13_16870 [Xylanibacillus composti]